MCEGFLPRGNSHCLLFDLLCVLFCVALTVTNARSAVFKVLVDYCLLDVPTPQRDVATGRYFPLD